MNDLILDQRLLGALCQGRAVALRGLIMLNMWLTGAESPTSDEAPHVRQRITALLAEATRLTAQIDQLEDAIDPPGSAYTARWG